MKWETIKTKAINLAYEQFKKEAVYEPSKVQMLLLRLHLNKEAAELIKNPKISLGDNLKQQLWDQIKGVIDQWDIRWWKGLKELYPNAFPVGNLSPEIKDDGWHLN